MAALPADRVHGGFWIDYTHGPILGATITTSSSNANLVVAVLSIVVSFAGSHLWDLIAFASHWIEASNQPRALAHHQRQLLTRNVASPGTFLLEALKLAWAWRHHHARPRLRSLDAFALLCSVGFLVAGVFASQVVSTSNLQVLVKSRSCGYLPWDNPTTDQGRNYQDSVFSQATIYSEACYNKTSHLPQCNVFVKQAIPIQNTTRSECPFQDLCTTSSALRLDTGLLDSNDMFGINADKSHRVQMQKVITCAPIDHDRFFTARPYPAEILRRYDAREPFPAEQIYEWFFGPLTAVSRSWNSTFWVSNYTSKLSRIYDLTPRASYASIGDEAIDSWHNSTFDAIPELHREDADTHIVAIQNNGILFYAPNNDPLFSAHVEKFVTFDDNRNITMYTGDSPTTFLGCAEQMRFCFANAGCTALLGVNTAYNQAQKIVQTSQQNATLYYLFAQSPTVYRVTQTPLRVTRNAASFQSGVPSNQWELEVRAWFNFLLSLTQSTITHLAAGPGIVQPDYDEQVEALLFPDFCHRQRMGAPDGYSNINVVGLTLVVTVSGIIMLVNVSLVPMVKYLNRTHRLSSVHVTSWVDNGLLQVQQKAYEGLGYRNWARVDTDVPTMKDDINIPRLNAETPVTASSTEPKPQDTEAFTHLSYRSVPTTTSPHCRPTPSVRNQLTLSNSIQLAEVVPPEVQEVSLETGLVRPHSAP